MPAADGNVAAIGRARFLAHVAVVAVIYATVARLSLTFALVDESTSAVWAPTGIAIAALLLGGRRLWPGVAIGALVANLATSGAWTASLVIAGGNTLEALLAWLLVTRYASGPAAFERPRDIFAFAALAGGVATIVSASIGTIALLVFLDARVEDAAHIWTTWWLGDAGGALVVTPAIVLLLRPITTSRSGRSPWEALALAAMTLVVAYGVFAPQTFSDRNYPTAFFIIPPMIWWAFRFGTRSTARASLLVAAAAVLATDHGYGPFASLDANAALLLTQAFNGVVAMSFVGLAAAIEQHRRTEDALQLAAERDEAAAALARAQAITHIGSWEWDVPADRVSWSEEMYRVYGLDAATFQPTFAGFLDRVHPDDRDRVATIIQDAYTSHQPFDFYHRAVRPDGSVRELHSQGLVVEDEQGNVVRMVGTGHDVTELRAAERDREALLAEQTRRVEAEAAVAVRDEFLSIAAHELKTPVTGVHAALQYLARQVRSPQFDIDRTREIVDLGERQSSRLGRLVSQLLETVRIDSGRFAVELTEADLATIVRDITEQVLLLDDHRAIIDGPASIPARLDVLRIEQVVANVVENAMKFSPAGSIIEIQLWSTPSEAGFAVRDHGPGLPPAIRTRVFERFEQGTAGMRGGLGLGLYVARQIVEAHGGTIAVEDAEGGGAQFIVKLPTSR